MRTMNTGFVTILVNGGPDTVRITFAKYEGSNAINFTCALSAGEIDRLIDLLKAERRHIPGDILAQADARMAAEDDAQYPERSE